MHRTRKRGSLVDPDTGDSWSRVEGPQPWTPTECGDEVTGRYGGILTKLGPYGEYRVLVLICETETYHISGQALLDLLSGAGELTGDHILRVVYLGEAATSQGRALKKYDLFVQERDMSSPSDPSALHSDLRSLRKSILLVWGKGEVSLERILASRKPSFRASVGSPGDHRTYGEARPTEEEALQSLLEVVEGQCS